MNANGGQDPATASQDRPTKRQRTTENSSQANEAQTQRHAHEAQQIQPFAAGPANGHQNSDAANAAQGPVSQTDLTLPINTLTLNDGGLDSAHHPNELDNHSVAYNQPVHSNKPTPDEVAKMQYNLFFGHLQEQPDAQNQPQDSSRSQAVGHFDFDSYIDPALSGDAPMNSTYQFQGQPIQQEEVPQITQQQQASQVQPITEQPVQHQSAEVDPAEQQADGFDLFGDQEFEQYWADLAPLMEFNQLN